MRTRLAGIGLAAALALAGPSARAEGPLEPPDLGRYLRWGPIRARPGLILTNLGYDGNIFYRTDVPPVSDYTATLSPRLDGLVLFGEKAFLTFTEQLDWTIYKTYFDQNYLDRRFSSRLTLPVKRMGVYVDVVRNHVMERPADQLDVRTERYEKRWGAGVLFKTGWRSDAEVGVFRASYDYNDENNPTIDERLNRTEDGVRALGRYLVFGRTRLTLEASSSEITFESQAIGRDATQKRALPGVEFGLGGRLTGTARVGWSKLDSKNPLYPDFSGAVGNARLAYRFGAGTTLQLGGLRDVGFSIYMRTGYYLQENYDLRVIQYFNRMFGAEVGALRGRLSFPDPDPRVDWINQFDAGLRVRLSETTIGRKVEYSLKVTNWNLTSSEPGLDQSRTVFGIGAVIGY